MRMNGRLELRCHEEDLAAFAKAIERDGDRSIAAWLLRLARVAARTATTMISVSALVKP